MIFNNHFNPQWLSQLTNKPMSSIEGNFSNARYSARLALPEYAKRLVEHYNDLLRGDLYGYASQVEIPFSFRHYGLIIQFNEPVSLELHDDDMVLDEGLRHIIAQVGAVIIRNAYMVARFRDRGHRNRFPHLNFHIDRSVNQPTQYSMYTRNPFDEEQKYPRTSSTLFIPSIVGNLQAVREGLVSAKSEKGLRGTYTLFTRENPDTFLDKVVLEHAWDEPEGVGEISMLDNRTSLHASYYRDPSVKGYKIGVRYLA